MSIGLGMILSQSLSIPFAKRFQWRYVLLVGEAFALLLLLSSIALGQARPGSRGQDERQRLLESNDGESGQRHYHRDVGG